MLQAVTSEEAKATRKADLVVIPAVVTQSLRTANLIGTSKETASARVEATAKVEAMTDILAVGQLPKAVKEAKVIRAVDLLTRAIKENKDLRVTPVDGPVKVASAIQIRQDRKTMEMETSKEVQLDIQGEVLKMEALKGAVEVLKEVAEALKEVAEALKVAEVIREANLAVMVQMATKAILVVALMVQEALDTKSISSLFWIAIKTTGLY